MPYEGYRFSLVFHSDKSGRGWAYNGNGWHKSKHADLDETHHPTTVSPQADGEPHSGAGLDEEDAEGEDELEAEDELEYYLLQELAS